MANCVVFPSDRMLQYISAYAIFKSYIEMKLNVNSDLNITLMYHPEPIKPIGLDKCVEQVGEYFTGNCWTTKYNASYR